MIPAIASFFDISTDDLFDFNLFEIEKQVEAICDAAYPYRFTDPAMAEQILRDGLARYPGNDVILNNLLYTLDYKTRALEVIPLCKSLIASTKDDTIKYDAYRILAECYKENGQYDLIKPTLEMIPEIYFTKLGLMALLLEDTDSLEAAEKETQIAAEHLVDMLTIAGKRFQALQEPDKARVQFEIAQKVMAACSLG